MAGSGLMERAECDQVGTNIVVFERGMGSSFITAESHTGRSPTFPKILSVERGGDQDGGSGGHLLVRGRGK